VLIGEYEHSLDAKGRLIMPAKLREDIGEKFIITKGLDGCLFGFSQNEWTNFEEKLKTLPLTNKNARDFVRFFLSGATECEIDKQGRFLIAGNLREYAEMEKEVAIIGVGTRIEIWNKEKWKQYNSDENISADAIAENMTMLGI
jgi:MraZ protein